MPSYGWIDIGSRGISVLRGVYELAAAVPGIDLVFCSVEDWNRDIVADRRPNQIVAEDGRRVTVQPDMYCPRGMIHGIDAPPKVPTDIGATWS